MKDVGEEDIFLLAIFDSVNTHFTNVNRNEIP